MLHRRQKPTAVENPADSRMTSWKNLRSKVYIRFELFASREKRQVVHTFRLISVVHRVEEPRKQLLIIRVNPREKQAFEKQAEAEELTVSEWARMHLLAIAAPKKKPPRK